METAEDKLREAVAGLAKDGRAPCKALLELARRMNVPPRRVGELCDELNIRIRVCQLGCFE